ncbi:cysteine hydrolase family protein [Protaetiibacter intestinalis]|uniref:Cysteine hydrolase n=1 Tax=Protaetiibacter intestinalis TaxID=2419774 RepID=A0A387B881_9MICO|nr:cysteine hydrolase family protein [Protaetiibacter intestinalis]AYF98553.1 cysteine hydrolase [Protaetiibacter intestinalis]
MTQALLVIDVQESFRSTERWQTISNPSVVDAVARLVARFREHGSPVFWILHADPGSGNAFDPENGLVQVLAELEPAPGEQLLVKTTINAFTSTDLEELLRAEGVDEVVLCGIRTEQCVEPTARIATDLGFATTVVIDATATNPAGALSAREVIERTAEVLAAREFAEVVTLESLGLAAPVSG